MVQGAGVEKHWGRKEVLVNSTFDGRGRVLLQDERYRVLLQDERYRVLLQDER